MPKLPRISLDKAKALLATVDTVEKATSLTPEAKVLYFKALDKVYGPREFRARDMGFGKDIWFHGTDRNSDIKQFDLEKLGSHTGEGTTKDRFWFSDNPEVAAIFAKSADTLKTFQKYNNVEDAIWRRQADIYSSIEKHVKDKGLGLDQSQVKKIFQDPMLRRAMKKSGELSDEQITLLKEYDDLGIIEGAKRADKKRAAEDSHGKIIPVRIRDGNIPEKDMAGAVWMKNANDIPEGEVKLKNFYEDAGPESGTPIGTSVGVLNPSKIRSVNAAFDPRFKKSSNIMAGVAAMPAMAGSGPVDMSPLPSLKEGIEAYYKWKESTVDPLVEKAAGYLKPAIDQATLANRFPGNKSVSDDAMATITGAGKMAADPVNFIPGPMGLGVNAVMQASELAPKYYKGGIVKALDQKSIDKLIKSGKLTEETAKSFVNLFCGGKVQHLYNGGGPIQDPEADQAPAVDVAPSASLEKSPFPYISDEEWTKMPPQLRLATENPNLAAQESPSTLFSDIRQGATDLISQAVQGKRDREAAALGKYGMGGGETEASLADPEIEGINPSVSDGTDKGALVADGMQMQAQPFDEPMDMMKQGMMKELEASQQEAAAGANAAINAERQIRKAQQDEMKLNMERELSLSEEQTKYDKAAQSYLSAKIDPNRFYKNQTTAQKIGTAISLFLSGAAGSNAGMQLLNNAIDRDIDAQKGEISTKRDIMANRRSVYQDMLDKFKDQRSAIQATKLVNLQLAELQLKQQLARAQGTRAYAEGLKGLATLQAGMAKTAKEFQYARMLSGDEDGPQSKMQFAEAVMSMPEKDRDLAVRLPGNKLGIALSKESATNLKNLMPSYEGLENIYRQMKEDSGFMAGPSARGKLASLKAQALLLTKNVDKTGTLDAQVERVFDNMIGDPTSINQPKFKAQIDSTLNTLQARKEAELKANLINYNPVRFTRK